MVQDEKVLMEVVENMPEGLTDMQKVRYVYLEVCRFFVYNPEYITVDDEKKYQIFHSDIDINEKLNHNAICSSLSKALIALLDKIRNKM